jgi:DNA-binding PadR family transcriptional regulator
MDVPGAWFGEHGMRGRRGPRAKRGDVRAAALALLAEEPMNGYQIIQAISERSDGVWRPSPGSVYPALQQLEDEGLIRAQADEGGRRAYQLTDEGHSYVDAHPDEIRAPWDAVAGSVGDTALQMRSLVGQVGMAAFQVVSAGTDSQVAQARTVLTDARKALYRLLAADDEDTTGGGAPAGE